MKRQTLLYFLMLAATGACLWAVMRVGARLEAPADLGGDWTFNSGPVGPEAGGPERLGEGFHIDQSGRFLRVRFDNGRQLHLRAKQLPHGKIGVEPQPVDLGDGLWHLSGTVHQEDGKLVGSFTLKGPEKAKFVAYRDPPELEKPPAVAPKLPPPTASAATSTVSADVQPATVALVEDGTRDPSTDLPAAASPVAAPPPQMTTNAVDR